LSVLEKSKCCLLGAMAKTVLLSLGLVGSIFTIFSFIYYTEKSSKHIEADNILYNYGGFIDYMWFTHREDKK